MGPRPPGAGVDVTPGPQHAPVHHASPVGHAAALLCAVHVGQPASLAHLPADRPPASAPATLPTPGQIEATILTWYRGLNADQQWVFRSYLDDITLTFPPRQPPELAGAIRPQL